MTKDEAIAAAHEFVSSLARNEELDDSTFCEVLEELIDRAETELDAKREEMGTS